jgi:hypothetical protein
MGAVRGENMEAPSLLSAVRSPAVLMTWSRVRRDASSRWPDAFTQPQGSGRPSGSELDSGGPHESRQSQGGKDSGGLQASTFLRNAKRVEEERPMDYGKSRIRRSEDERKVVLDVSNAVRRYGQMWKLPRVTYIETYDCSGVGEY